MYSNGQVDYNSMMAIGVGGFGALSLGFADDLFSLSKLPKFILQWCLAIWAFYIFRVDIIEYTKIIPFWLAVGFILLSFVWLINLYCVNP